MLQITRYQPKLLPSLTRLVNAHIALVPPCWTLTDAQVQAVIASAGKLWSARFPDEDETRVYDAFVVEGDRVRAAAQWITYNDYAILLWIFAEPGADGALAALLEAIVQQAQGLSAVNTNSRFAFGVGWFGIPPVWAHLFKGMARAGFEVTERWVIMHAPTADVPVSAPPAGLTLDCREDAEGDWHVTAQADAAEVGLCEAWEIPPHFAACDGFDRWITVEWVGVADGSRGRGIGRWLLSEQMRFQRARGFEQVMVWTETDNAAAQRMNRALGFVNGPECWTLHRPLRDAPANLSDNEAKGERR